LSYDEPDPDYPIPQILTVYDVAMILGVTHRRVIALIRKGQLVATKLGREYMIRPQDFLALKLKRKYRPKTKPVGYTKAMRAADYRGRRRLP